MFVFVLLMFGIALSIIWVIFKAIMGGAVKFGSYIGRNLNDSLREKRIEDARNDEIYRQQVSNNTVGWICPSCGATNSGLLKVCDCGAHKPDFGASSSVRSSSPVRVAGGWTCPVCGKTNAPYTGTCGCGASKMG